MQAHTPFVSVSSYIVHISVVTRYRTINGYYKVDNADRRYLKTVATQYTVYSSNERHYYGQLMSMDYEGSYILKSSLLLGSALLTHNRQLFSGPNAWFGWY